MLKDNSPDLERQNRLRILLNEGKKIAGEATGIPNSSAIDEFLQGSGGVVGVTASMAVQRIGDEILSRQLGPREAGASRTGGHTCGVRDSPALQGW